jgi:hypothetical protein
MPILKQNYLSGINLEGFGKLNSSCSTCIRNAMQRLIKYTTDQIPPVSPKIHFIGTKQESITKMTFNQLKAEAKKRGITMARTSTKQDLIKALS